MRNKTTQIMIIATFLLALLSALLSYAYLPTYYRNKAVSPDDLSDFPRTTSYLNSYYSAWQSKDWDKMEKARFGTLDSSFYSEALSSQELTEFKIMKARAIDEYRAEFDVILTINGVDCLTSPKMLWDSTSNAWTLMEHDWEFQAFDWNAYVNNVVALSMKSRVYDAALVAVVVLLFGMVLTLVIRFFIPNK